MKISRQEFVIMETLWSKGRASIRDMVDGFPKTHRISYSAVQTMVYRLEAKGALARIRMSGNFHVFEPAVTREQAQLPLIDELLAILGGDAKPLVTRLVETGKLTINDVELAEQALAEARRKRRSQ